jgi:hypothetical protein
MTEVRAEACVAEQAAGFFCYDCVNADLKRRLSRRGIGSSKAWSASREGFQS